MINNQPHIIPVSEGVYRLDQDYTYEYSHDGQKFRLFIPEGFMYDGTSVPRILWTLTGITPDGIFRAASLVHDYIYNYEGKLPVGVQTYYDIKDQTWKIATGHWGRKSADKLFARMLREFGVSRTRRRFAYYAVRAFGYLYWN